MRKTLFLLTAGLMLASTAAMAAQSAPPAGASPLGGPKVAGVCLLSQQAVFANAKAGVAASARLNQLTDEAKAEIEGDTKPIQDDAKTLEGQRATLKPAELQQREQALNSRMQGVQQKAAQRSREIQVTREKALGQIAAAEQPLIATAYKAKGCGLLIDRNSVLGGNMDGDLTASVVQALDAAMPTITFNRETLPAQTASAAR
jgi:Skp family chaperone for outer membrane proteins